LDSKVRCVVVAKRPVDLRRLGDENTFFVLQLPEGFRTAMGSRGGYGERRLVRVYEFACGGGECKTVKVVEDEEALEKLEMPYHAAAMAVVHPDGTERLVAGVVDEELAAAYDNALR
jgi:hypothetical protein